MRALAAVAVMYLLACGDDSLGVGGSLDAGDPVVVDADLADGSSGDASVALHPACPVASDAIDATIDELVLELPDVPPPDLPFAIAVRTASGRPLSAAVQLCTDGRPLATLNLYRGRGSATVSLPEGDVELEAVASGARAERHVRVASRPVRDVGSAISDSDLSSSDSEDVRFQGDVQIPAGTSVIVPAGARLLFAAKAALQVAGHLELRGTAQQPILMTRSSDAPWGGLRLEPGASAIIEHAWFVAGGGDSGRTWGHSRSQPVIWIDHAELVMREGGVIDNPGKAFGSNRARVELDGALISRCDTGGEFAKSEVHVRNGHVLEMPDADGQANDDDNDGIYISGAAVDAEEQLIESSIEDMVFAVGEDDGIDHNLGQLRVERVWIERFRHEGIAASHGNRIRVTDSVVRRNGQGIEAGYGSPSVFIDHVWLTENDVGLRFGDDYGDSETGTIDVRNSIIRGNLVADVRNYVIQLDGPAPNAISIACSILSDASWVGMNGNADREPDVLCGSGPMLDAAECDGVIPGPMGCERD